MDLIQDYGSDDDDSIVEATSDVGEPSVKPQDSAAVEEISIVPSKLAPPGTFVRSIPHVPGNWAGHVFGPIAIQMSDDEDDDNDDDVAELRESLTKSLQRFQAYLAAIGYHHQQAGNNQLISHLDCDTLHLSLSRPFILQLASIESFVEQLRKRLCHLPAMMLRIHTTAEKVLVNDDRTRSFWTLAVDNPTLLAIVEEVDAVMKGYGQPTYYNPPHFHISIGSVVGDLETMTGTSSANIPQTNAGANSRVHYVALNQIHCTFGTTKCYKIKLLDR